MSTVGSGATQRSICPARTPLWEVIPKRDLRVGTPRLAALPETAPGFPKCRLDTGESRFLIA